MTRRRATAAESLFQTALDTSQMMFEAHAVMGMRIMGMAGMWHVGPSEYATMISEKQQAFANSAFAMGRATMAGSTPETIFNAGSKPLRTRTTANYKRLSKSGIKLQG